MTEQLPQLPQVPQLPSVQAMFAAQRLATPDLPAAEYRGEQLTYEQLGRRADHLAAQLARLCGPDTVVCLATDRSFHFPIAVLGILRAGAAYLPLDLGYPAERLEFMIRDSGAAVLLTQRDALTRLPVPAGVRVVLLDELLETAAPDAQTRPERAAAPEQLAYVMYTSGSTGVPKGVAMGHGPLSNLIAWQRAASDCGPESRTLQFSPASFDASFQEMFSTWACGGCLVLVDEEVRRDSNRLLAFVDEARVNRVFMPFVALQALARAADEQRRYPLSLTEIITAGEQLHVTPALRRFFTELPDLTLENQYGPSETHIVTALRLDPDPDGWPELPSIGRPISSARMYVLDEHGRPLPDGAEGELGIGGPVLARGYLNRPVLTAEKFVPDPAGAPGARLYRTGDLGRIEPDGRVVFLGRRDDQVKIRGHRVELGEVETALKAVPGPADAVVVVHEGAGTGRRLIAYLLADDGQASTVREQLAAALPGYMVPSVFVALDRFPLTPSGKVDRRALAERPVVVTSADRTAAQDELEREVLRLYEQSVGLSEVGVHENFFTLGGDSLIAVTLLSQLNARFGVELELAAFIEEPTVAALSARLRERAGTEAPTTGRGASA
ncbi:amino acid adenylation domain-containing protein [Streptomyces sp. NRRL WC-3742]|uniref:amino acid adenylation domain-containing protein n=1 Tax=Streptomyces sp. NRRL WC-3742 TaxID=1463934 RepID=UPI00068CE5FD|nr:amino acid adenylation domain-containing protein [Streptomyces sp. NRRL WC-3742]